MVKLPGLEPFAMDGYLYENLTAARKIVEDKKQSLILCNDGRTGLGKTTLSFQQAWLLARGDKRKFNLDHVLFDPEKSFEKIARSKKGDVWVFDEAIVFNSRSAMTSYNKNLMLLLSTIRSKQIYIILNIPSFFDLDKNVVLDKLHMLIHLYGNHFGDRGKFLVFDTKKILNLYIYGKKNYNYNCTKSNFKGRFGKAFLLDEVEYDKKKAKAVKEMLSSEKKMGIRTIKQILQRDYLLSYLNQKLKLTYEKINDFMPEELRLPQNTIADSLQRIRKKYNPEWFKQRNLELPEIDD